MSPTAHTEPHAAAILADLLNRIDPALLNERIIEEVRDYIAAARREHPHAQIALARSEAVSVRNSTGNIARMPPGSARRSLSSNDLWNRGSGLFSPSLPLVTMCFR